MRTTHGRTDEFIVVLDVISQEFRCGLPCELLFADDLTVLTDTEKEMQRR